MRALLAAVVLAAILPLSSSAFAATPPHAGNSHARGGDHNDHGFPWWRHHPGWGGSWGWRGPGVYIGPVYGYNYYRPRPVYVRPATYDTAGQVLAYNARTDVLTLTNGQRFVVPGGGGFYRGERVNIVWRPSGGERVVTSVRAI